MTSLTRRNGICPHSFLPQKLSFQTAALTEARMKVQHTTPVELLNTRIQERDCPIYCV